MHFAAFPRKLVTPCILAGTSAKGCCPKCGAPYRRLLEKIRTATRPGKNTKVTGRRGGVNGDSGEHSSDGRAQFRLSSEITGNRDPERHITSAKTIGWTAGCDCNAGDPVPCIVADPFGGTGTCAAVAIQHGRRAVTIDLNPEYIKIINRRVKKAISKKGFGL